MKTPLVVILTIIICVVVLIWIIRDWDNSPSPQENQAPPQYGGRFRGDADAFTGCGWSIHPDPAAAVGQALAGIPPEASQNSEIVFIFYTSHHAPEKVAKALRGVNGPDTQICGWSSDFGVSSPDGYHSGPEGTVGLMSMRLEGVRIGVGGASLDEAESPAACAKLALSRAIKLAGGGKTMDGPPSMIIMSCTYDGQEEVYMESLKETIGPSVPVMGGTAGGSSSGGAADCSVIANERVIRKGLTLTVMFSDLPFGWSFRGGFDRTGQSGVITASEGRVIREIDNRPALDVYNEWSGNRVFEAMEAGKNMNTFTGLYPLCRALTPETAAHNLFIHAWPPDDGATSKCLVTSANLWKGDVVHFSEGSWNILLNRIGVLPQQALENRPDMNVAAGLFVCCEAVLKNIPNEQRKQMANLINMSLGDTPWIGMFTWGEQGNFPGIGNYHGNLLTSMTLFPRSPDNVSTK